MEARNDSGARGVRGVRLVIIIVLVAVISVAATSLSFVLHYRRYAPVMQAMDLVSERYYYYGDLDKDQLITGAIKGVASYIGDEYAAYYTREEYEELMQSNSGFYIGMGILVSAEAEGVFVIASVFESTPAQEAGMLVGDRILQINDAPAAAYTDLTAFLENVDHTEGAVNTVTVDRGGEELVFVVTMREVYSPYVTCEMLTDTVGYLRIKAFQGECVSETQQALEELRAQGMQSLVLDVRDNLGGQLYAVNDIAACFLDKGSVITTVRSRTEAEVVYRTHTQGEPLPIAMLVNDYSASASELLAGALRDNGVAVLIGEKTYGKGIVQSYFGIYGQGHIKFTTDAYYTPSGVCIQGDGLAPDIAVALSDELSALDVAMLAHEEDAQLQAALEYLASLPQTQQP